MKHPREGATVGSPGARRCHGDSGAALVEFAMVAPLLLVLLFGIIEFGWIFGQHLDVRHGAREGSRLLAVNYNPDPNTITTGVEQRDVIVAEVCDRMDISTGADVTLAYLGTNSPGDFAQVTVTDTPDQLTGLFSPIVDSIDLTSVVESRIELEGTWSAGTVAC